MGMAGLRVPGLSGLLGAIAVLAGCASSPPPAPAGEQALRQSSGVASASAAPVAAPAVTETDAMRLARLAKPLENRSLHFRYDEYSVSQEQLPILQAHVEVLRSVPTAIVALEGNADERGSREYNLALAQKRADAVARVLKVSGINESRIESVSFGEEKPRETCHEERCWAENRRVDFRYRLAKER